MPTDVAALVASLSQFGGLGIVIAFLIWKDIRADRIREKMETDHRNQILLMEERRLNFDKDRLETDKDHIATITALTGAIQNFGKR